MLMPGQTLLIEPVHAGMGPLGPVIEVRALTTTVKGA